MADSTENENVKLSKALEPCIDQQARDVAYLFKQLTLLQKNTDALQSSQQLTVFSQVATTTTNGINTLSTASSTAVDSISNLRGMDCNTGKLISGAEYLQQRIADALLTPKASQVLLRARGSKLVDLIDSPMTPPTLASWMAAVAEALGDKLSGVPDFVLSRMQVDTASSDGKLGLSLYGDWLGDNVTVAV